MIKKEIVSSEGSLMLVKVYLAEGYIGDVDQHPEEQLSFIEKGKIEFEVNGEKRILSAGDKLYIPANVVHQVKVLEECVLLDIFTPVRQDLLQG